MVGIGPVVKWDALRPTEKQSWRPWTILSSRGSLDEAPVNDLLVVPTRTQALLIGLMGAPDIIVRFSAVNGVPEASEITFRATEGGRGVRASDLKTLPPLEHLCRLSLSLFATEIRSDYEGDPTKLNPGQDTVRPFDWGEIGNIDEVQFHLDGYGWPTVTTRNLPEFPKPVHPRVFDALFSKKRGVTRDELEAVAYTYQNNVQSNPTEAVQHAYGYTARTASRRVQQARDAGLLPPTTQGRKKA